MLARKLDQSSSVHLYVACSNKNKAFTVWQIFFQSQNLNKKQQQKNSCIYILQDIDDGGQTDIKSYDSSGDEDEEDDNFTTGDIVWGMCGKTWYPAKVCSLTNVSENMPNLFCNNQQKLILKSYYENNLSLVKESKVESLLDNKVDAKRVSRSSKLQFLCNTALFE